MPHDVAPLGTKAGIARRSMARMRSFPDASVGWHAPQRWVAPMPSWQVRQSASLGNCAVVASRTLLMSPWQSSHAEPTLGVQGVIEVQQRPWGTAGSP